MLRRIALLAACLSAVSPGGEAASAEPYNEREGHWTIVSVVNSCAAFNRPPNEYNSSPFNSLYLKLSKEGVLTMQAAFWPGYLDPSESYKLRMGTEAAANVSVPAKPLSFAPDFIIETDASAADAVRKMLARGKQLAVGLEGKPESLTFEIDALARVLPMLEQCVGRMKDG